MICIEFSEIWFLTHGEVIDIRDQQTKTKLSGAKWSDVKQFLKFSNRTRTKKWTNSDQVVREPTQLQPHFLIELT